MCRRRIMLPLMVFFTLNSSLFTSFAQEMHILQFAKVKKGLFNMNHIVIDKQQAILDLKTSESGFTFLANGKAEIAAEEGEGMLTLKTPDKTAFIVVKHPDYGQLTWKVPAKKGLRKKKRYTATLAAVSPDKEFKLQKQWVIFEIQPKDAILTVDSTMTLIHDGKKQFYLPIGKHTFLAESPFHQQEEGDFELTDEGHQTISLSLQPIYSYINVKTSLEGCDILVDGQFIGKTQGTSGHLREGDHNLIVLKDSLKYYDATVNVGWREKKTIELKSDELHPILSSRSKTNSKTVKKSQVVIAQSTTAKDSKTTAVAPIIFETVDDSLATMQSKESDFYGMVNVHSNEIGANVYVDGKLQGTTPCIVKQLTAGRKCRIRLSKKGFYDTEKVILVEGNDLTFVKLDLKKKK